MLKAVNTADHKKHESWIRKIVSVSVLQSAKRHEIARTMTALGIYHGEAYNNMNAASIIVGFQAGYMAAKLGIPVEEYAAKTKASPMADVIPLIQPSSDSPKPKRGRSRKNVETAGAV